MRQLIARLVVPTVAGIAVLTGCSGPTTDTPEATAPAPVVADQAMPGMSMPPAAGSAAASGQDAPVATNAVAIQNFAFSPAVVTVKAGTTVTWTNQDQDPHTATAMSGPFRSPTLNKGQSYHYTFTTPGRFEYLCTIHPFMTATVVVTP
ncbi:MAG: cupredoxin domain-containing protein [Pseudonocardiaceae bacterium]